MSAIFAKVCKSGCDEFEHHLLTVHADFPICSANHLLVLSCSARTAFMRFNLSIISKEIKAMRKDNIILWQIYVFVEENLKYYQNNVSSYYRQAICNRINRIKLD
jgi:hypothetical protein